MLNSMYPGPRRLTFSNDQVVIITIVVMLIILGSGLLLYTSVANNIARIKASSTAIARADASQVAFDATNNAVVSSDVATAQVALTSQARANMTATPRAYANATATAAARATGTAQAYASATAQAYANRDPYPPYTGKLVLSDPLNNNSQGHGWDMFAQAGNGTCQFVGGAYQSATQLLDGGRTIANDCIAENTSFNNFAFQADVTVVSGSCGGIVFRANSKTSSLYDFFTCTGSGYWGLRSAMSGNFNANIINGNSPAIHPTAGQANLLAVVANGQTITLYANGQVLTTVTDGTFSSGQIGLEASGNAADTNVATFRNVEVWTM